MKTPLEWLTHILDPEPSPEEMAAAMTSRNWCLVPSPELAVKIYRRYGPEHDREAGG